MFLKILEIRMVEVTSSLKKLTYLVFYNYITNLQYFA